MSKRTENGSVHRLVYCTVQYYRTHRKGGLVTLGSAIWSSKGGLASVRKSCFPVRPTKRGAMGVAMRSKNSTPSRNGSWPLPLTPRCGVANVMKHAGCSPAIVPPLPLLCPLAPSVAPVPVLVPSSCSLARSALALALAVPLSSSSGSASLPFHLSLSLQPCACSCSVLPVGSLLLLLLNPLVVPGSS